MPFNPSVTLFIMLSKSGRFVCGPLIRRFFGVDNGIGRVNVNSSRTAHSSGFLMDCLPNSATASSYFRVLAGVYALANPPIVDNFGRALATGMPGMKNSINFLSMGLHQC